jgi:DoxX-like family
MKDWRKAGRIAGRVLHGLIGGLMIFGGSGKLFGFAPPQIVENLSQYGLADKMQLIGGGELITALLLLIPPTLSLGVLLASSYWGGVICIHMSHGEDYVFPSVLLALTWIGAYLRNPLTLSSFTGGAVARP